MATTPRSGQPYRGLKPAPPPLESWGPASPSARSVASVDQQVDALNEETLASLAAARATVARLAAENATLRGQRAAADALARAVTKTSWCLGRAGSLCAAWSGRGPEHLSEFLANFESGLTSGRLPHRRSRRTTPA